MINYCIFCAWGLRPESSTLYLMWRSEQGLPHVAFIPIRDDPRSHPKGIPTYMVLAPLPTNVYRLRLYLPRRHCKRICAIPAPCTSISFPFRLISEHTFPFPVQNLPVWRRRRALPISFPFALLTAPEKANLLGSGIGLYIAYHLERYYRRRREVRSSLITHVTLIY